MTTTYTLRDTFNGSDISRHRSLEAAAKADVAHGRAVRRHNGQSSYIPTAIIDSDGNDVCHYDHDLNTAWLRARDLAGR